MNRQSHVKFDLDGLSDQLKRIRKNGRVDFKAQLLRDMVDEIKALRRDVYSLRLAGTPLANIAFNLAQRPGENLSLVHCNTLDTCRKDWDAAILALNHIVDATEKVDVQSVRNAALDEAAAMFERVYPGVADRIRGLKSAPPQKPEDAS